MVPVEIATMQLTPEGFRLTFTAAMDAARLQNVKTYRLASTWQGAQVWLHFRPALICSV